MSEGHFHASSGNSLSSKDVISIMGKLGLAPIAILLLAGLPAFGQQEQSAPGMLPVASSQPDLKPDAKGNLSQEQMRQLFHVVAEKDIENDKKQRDYTYIERDEEHKLDGKGEVKSTESETFEVMEIYGRQMHRRIAKDDKPLSGKDAAKEEERIQKIIDKRKNESEGDRKKREEQEEKQREEDRKWVREVADAYNFQLVGTEQIEGRDNWVIEGVPRPGYTPHLKDAKYLPYFRGRVWIDQKELQLTKLDVECIDTLSWGLVVARLHKGSRLIVEQTRVNDEVWLPKRESVKLSVRVALFKNVNIDEDDTYRDYRKFRATARIVGVGEVKP
jgi:hypothetical protein